MGQSHTFRVVLQRIMIKTISILGIMTALSLVPSVQGSSIDEEENSVIKGLSLLPIDVHVKINASMGHGSEIADPNPSHPAHVALFQKEHFLRPRYLTPEQLVTYVKLAKEHGVWTLGPLILDLHDYAVFSKQNRAKTLAEKETSSLRRALNSLDKDFTHFSALTLVCTQVVYQGVGKELIEDLKALPSPLGRGNVTLTVSRVQLLEDIQVLKGTLEDNAYALYFNPKEHLNSLIKSFQSYITQTGEGHINLEI
jgi:hypothetical protein